jgi:integrase
MASICNDPGGYRRLLFVDASGQRRTIRLGRISERSADRIKVHVEHVVTAAKHRTQLDPETAAWLARIGDDLAAKLAAVGLIPQRRTGDANLAQFLNDYRAHRADVAKGTNTNYGIVGARLLAFFPGETHLRSITEGDADRWLVWLKQEYAGPTVSKSVKVARQFWAQAIRDGLAGTNPFAHLRTPSEVNTARAHFVDRPTFARVLEACPDHEWRLLLALARYGGLRTPSEPLTLQWGDVNWERQRFRVVAPKTKHEDGGERWVPLFPELLPFLEEAFEKTAPGATHVITRYRDTNANLRTQLGRIIRRAGAKTWPRLFQNLRASRETELAETFPIHVTAE